MKKFTILAIIAVLMLISASSFALKATVGELKVVHNVELNGKKGVRFIVYDVKVSGHKDKQFYTGHMIVENYD